MNILERASFLLKNIFDQDKEVGIKDEVKPTSDMTSEPQEQHEDSQVPKTRLSLSEADQRFIANLNATITRFISDPDLDVEMLAREMAMSHTIFYEKVRNVIGITPCNLIKNARMQRARNLLTTTTATVADVAEQCGFPNWRYFSTVYKKHWGYSPSKEVRAHANP